LLQRLREDRDLLQGPPLVLTNRANAALRELSRANHLHDASFVERSLGRAASVQIEHEPTKLDRPGERHNQAMGSVDRELFGNRAGSLRAK
jgi:hypothetical protein